MAKTEPAAVLLLDRSGSMESCRDITVEGVNAFLDKLQHDPSGKRAAFELITFDSLGFDTVRKGLIDDISPIKRAEYEPRAMTPLHDAVMHAADRLAAIEASKRMLIIVTDGLENASKRHQRLDVQRTLAEAQQSGWIVIYLAAHIDAWAQAAEIGIPKERAMNFKAGPATVKAGGIRGWMGGTKPVNPLAIALGAAAGIGLAAIAAPHMAHALGFDEKQRNDAMGVDDNWQQAVQDDIAAFNEPMSGMFDMPPELAEAHATLPQDFDPTQGSMNADGEQPGAPDGDLLDEYDAAEHAGDLEDDAAADASDITDPADLPSTDTEPPGSDPFVSNPYTTDSGFRREDPEPSAPEPSGGGWSDSGGSSDSGGGWSDSGGSFGSD